MGLNVDWVQFVRGFLAVMTVTALGLWGPSWIQANQALFITVGFELVLETLGLNTYLFILFHWQWCWLQVVLLAHIAILRRMEREDVSDQGVKAYTGCMIFVFVFLTTYLVPDKATRQWFRMYITLFGLTVTASTPFTTLGYNIAQSLTGMAIALGVSSLPLPTLASDQWKEALMSLIQAVDKRQRGLFSVFKIQEDQALEVERSMIGDEHVKKQIDGLTAKLPLYGLSASFEFILTDPNFEPKAPVVAGLIQSLEVHLDTVALNVQKLGTLKYDNFKFDSRLGDSLDKMSALLSCMLLQMCKTLKGQGYWNINLFYTQDFSKLTGAFGDGAAKERSASYQELSAELQDEAKAFWALLGEVHADCLDADNADAEVINRAALDTSGLHSFMTASYFNLLRIVELTDESTKQLEQLPPRSMGAAYKAACTGFCGAIKKLVLGQFYMFKDGLAIARLALAFRVALAVTVGALWALIDGLINGLGGSFATRAYWVAFTVAAIWLDDSSAMPKRGVDRIFGTLAGVIMGHLWAFYMGNYEWSMQVWMIAVYFVDRLVFTTWTGHSYQAGAFRYAFLFAIFGGIEAVPDGVDINSSEARSLIIETLEDRIVLTCYGAAICVIVSLTIFPSRASERFYKKSVPLLVTWTSILDLITTKIETNDNLSEDDTKALAELHAKSGGLLKGQQADAGLAEQDWVLWYTTFEGVSAQEVLKLGNAVESSMVMMGKSLTAEVVGPLKANKDVHDKLVKSMLSLREAVVHLEGVVSGSHGKKAELVDFAKFADTRKNVEELIAAAETAGFHSVSGDKAQGVSDKELSAFDAFTISFLRVAKSMESFALLLENRTDQTFANTHWYSLKTAACGPCGTIEVETL